jgi:hypothetical protein
MDGARRALRYLSHDGRPEVTVNVVHDQPTGSCEHDEDDVELGVGVSGHRSARAEANQVDVQVSRPRQAPVHTVALCVEKSGQIGDFDVDASLL